MKMVMQYGDVQKGPMAPQGLELLDAGTVLDDTTVELTFEPGGMYLLFCAEYTASSGAFRGQRIISIKAPESEKFGTTAIARGNVYESSDSGVKLTYNNDSTLSIAQASSIFAVRYALYKAF